MPTEPSADVRKAFTLASSDIKRKVLKTESDSFHPLGKNLPFLALLPQVGSHNPSSRFLGDGFHGFDAGVSSPS